MGRRPRPKGPVRDAVLVVDKPAGPTSHDVVAAVRRVIGHSRVGHTGTLDPAATGVLVLGLGRATKLVRFLQAGTKTYAARIHLGVETDTQDAEGVVLATTDASHLDERTVCEVLTRFQGEFEQVPPMVSALKVDGERLHAKARRGEEVERAARRVRVDSLVLDAFTAGEVTEVSVLLTCSAGTYVRTIAHDVGAVLGVGGSLASLRRIANGPFVVDEAHTLDEVVGAGQEGVPALSLDVVSAIERVLEVEHVTDEDLARRVTQGRSAPALGRDRPVALIRPASAERPPQLLAIVADDGAGRSRPELVWTRPEELA
ncbi:MAG: tRNA pseudouridine(55) synthase TruB [Nitriliruptoraceae bacterium]